MPTNRFRQLANQYQENCNRIQEIANLCTRENRVRNEAEEAEYQSLLVANQALAAERAAINPYAASSQLEGTSLTQQLRDQVHNNVRGSLTYQLMRDAAPMTSAGLADTGLIPVEEQEVLKPLRAGLIYDKVGLNIRSGLAAGKLRWPIHTKAVASIEEEGARLADSSINFSKLTVSPVRVGCAIPVTKEELESTDGIVEAIIREEMPAAVCDVINDALFNITGKFTDAAGTEKNRTVYGPLVKAAQSATTFASTLPTRKELLAMKAKIVKAGIQMTHPCWVMTEDLKAELEDVKVDAGSGRFLCENDMILGIPVFTTNAIASGYVALGDWGYQAFGFFGNTNFVVDPYTLARQNSTDFVLNMHFATVTLREDAFVVGKCKASA